MSCILRGGTRIKTGKAKLRLVRAGGSRLVQLAGEKLYRGLRQRQLWRSLEPLLFFTSAGDQSNIYPSIIYSRLYITLVVLFALWRPGAASFSSCARAAASVLFLSWSAYIIVKQGIWSVMFLWSWFIQRRVCQYLFFFLCLRVRKTKIKSPFACRVFKGTPKHISNERLTWFLQRKHHIKTIKMSPNPSPSLRIPDYMNIYVIHDISSTARHKMSPTSPWSLHSTLCACWTLDQDRLPKYLWCHKSWLVRPRLLKSVFQQWMWKTALMCRTLHGHHSTQWGSNIQLQEQEGKKNTILTEEGL